jgi:NAD(P)-dependent dehydrogenase (short-subunit alcohol dehydrogenase family)
MTNESASREAGLLSGKVIFITGASSGIGAAAAHLFSAEGAAVVLSARNVDALDQLVTTIRVAGGIADAVVMDLTDSDSIRAAVARVEQLHGRLDGAFNNGGVNQQQIGPLDTTTDDDIDEQFTVNFRAHWTAMNAEAALMRRSGGGAIVNTSSIGSRRAVPPLPAYGAMKRALNSITETAAVTWAPEGIRVNGLMPGGTATEMMDEWEAKTPGVIAASSAASPMGRMAEAREVAEAAAWLLSDRASAVTGAIVPVDTTSEDDLDEQFTVNFRAHWTAMNAEAALMRRSGGGAIVNTSSIGSRRAVPPLPAYGAMKRALNSITETAAVTWAPEGIRVNGLMPGGTATEMMDEWEAKTPGVIAASSAASPMGRMAEAREVAEAAAWLLSDRASAVTGAIMPVDCGSGA